MVRCVIVGAQTPGLIHVGQEGFVELTLRSPEPVSKTAKSVPQTPPVLRGVDVAESLSIVHTTLSPQNEAFIYEYIALGACWYHLCVPS